MNKIHFINSLIIKASGPMLGFLILYVVSHKYSREVLGFYTVLIQVLVLLGIFIRGGNDFILIKFGKELMLDRNLSAVYSIFIRVLINSVFMFCILALLVNIVSFEGEFYSYVKSYPFLFAIAAFSFGLFNLSISYLIALQQPQKSIYYQSFIYQFLIVSLYLIFPAEIEVILISIATVSTFIFIFIIIQNTNYDYGIREKVFLPIGRWKGFSLSASEFLMFNSDLIVLSFFVSLDVVAVYALASRIIMMYGFYVQVQNAYIANQIASINKHDFPGLKHVFISAIKLNIVMALLYLLGIFIASHMVVRFFGDAYQEVFQFVYILLGAGVTGMLLGFSVNFFFLVSSDSKNFFGAPLNIGLSVFFVLTIIFFTKDYGVIGLAYSILLFKVFYYISFFLLSLNHVRKTTY